jgi:hypothetical protein
MVINVIESVAATLAVETAERGCESSSATRGTSDRRTPEAPGL